MDVLGAISTIIGKNINTPIIMHTSFSEYKDNFLSWAEDAYVVKSSDLTELKMTINDLVTEKLVTA